jgi:hypothetical protein
MHNRHARWDPQQAAFTLILPFGRPAADPGTSTVQHLCPAAELRLTLAASVLRFGGGQGKESFPFYGIFLLQFGFGQLFLPPVSAASNR